MGQVYRFYRVFYRYVDAKGKVRRDHVKLDALNMDDAKRRVIRGEKKEFNRNVAVDRVVRL
tara:strand:+ start:6379 stop:6561 length:183 start_codon:yes stop_codon:yes gene_type:complete